MLKGVKDVGTFISPLYLLRFKSFCPEFSNLYSISCHKGACTRTDISVSCFAKPLPPRDRVLTSCEGIIIVFVVLFCARDQSSEPS